MVSHFSYYIAYVNRFLSQTNNPHTRTIYHFIERNLYSKKAKPFKLCLKNKSPFPFGNMNVKYRISFHMSLKNPFSNNGSAVRCVSVFCVCESSANLFTLIEKVFISHIFWLQLANTHTHKRILLILFVDKKNQLKWMYIYLLIYLFIRIRIRLITFHVLGEIWF